MTLKVSPNRLVSIWLSFNGHTARRRAQQFKSVGLQEQRWPKCAWSASETRQTPRDMAFFWVKTVLGSHFGVGEFTTHFRSYFSGWMGMNILSALRFACFPPGFGPPVLGDFYKGKKEKHRRFWGARRLRPNICNDSGCTFPSSLLGYFNQCF